MNQNNVENLKQEMASFFHAFRQECLNLTKNVDKQLQQSLQQQQKEMIYLAQESINQGLNNSINHYNELLSKSESSLGARIRYLEETLDEINRKNRQLVIRSWLVTSISLGVLIIGAAYLLYHYKTEIDENRITANMTKIINQSDLTICGDRLCAAVSSQKHGKYRVVNIR